MTITMLCYAMVPDKGMICYAMPCHAMLCFGSQEKDTLPYPSCYDDINAMPWRMVIVIYGNVVAETRVYKDAHSIHSQCSQDPPSLQYPGLCLGPDAEGEAFGDGG